MQFHVPSMTCGHCVRTLTRAVQALDPAAQLQADLAAQTVTITTTAARERVLAAFAAQDYPATPIAATAASEPSAAGAGGCCRG